MIYQVKLAGHRTVLHIKAKNRPSAIAQAKFFKNKSLTITIGEAKQLGLERATYV
jgi:hypothetical protein